VDVTHSYIGDLRVELQAPTGRSVVLHGQLGGSDDDLRMTYDSAPPSPLAALVGQPIQGDWVLRVADLALRDKGMLNHWSIQATAAP
jgi:subtilisin-like proprotein convertase family protein